MVSPVSLTQVSTVADIIDQGRWLLQLGSVPGGGDTVDLAIRCFNATIPGTSSEVMEVPMHQFMMRYRGRKMNASPMSVSFWEDSYMTAYEILWDWSEAVTNTESGNSIGFLKDYSITASLSVFNTIGEEAAKFRFWNLFPSDLTDVNLTVESSAPIQVQCQFSFRNKQKVPLN